MTILGDFETRSAGSIKDLGSYMYSLHHSTQVLCFSWAYDDEDTLLWHPAYPEAGLEEFGASDLLELHERIILGEEFHAWNVFFERCIWTNVCVPKLDWPELEPEQLHCSAALAASYALPRKLEHAAPALALGIEKDMKGHRLMLKLSKPRKPRVAELKQAGFVKGQHDDYTLEHGYLWHEKPEELQQVFDYCRTDVKTERAVTRQLRPLSPSERRIWLMDQEINWRGIHCDGKMVDKALDLVATDKAEINEELRVITLGDVSKGSQRPSFQAWLHSEGVPIPGTAGEVIDEWLTRDDLEDHVRRALELWKSFNRTSTKKYDAMRARLGRDSRIRDLLRYWAASTGRWGGVGIQPQNFPRGRIKDMGATCAKIIDLSRDELLLLYDDLIELLSWALRGALCAPPGRDLLCADFSAIEARGTFWAARDKPAIEMFRRIDAGEFPGEDIYTWEASTVHGRKIMKSDPERQDTGKPMILGCGYQMGGAKLVSYSAGMGVEMTEERGKELVAAYRAKHKPVKKFWYAMEAAAIEAVQRGPRAKQPVKCGPTAWAQRGRFLHCRLPSGRLLSYCDPAIVMAETPWGEPKHSLRFMGVDTYTKKWSRQATYGGKLVENVIQALSRDIMAEGMLRIDAHADYDIVLSVHDEVLAEADQGRGDLTEFESLLAQVPTWCPDLPLTAEGWRGQRYRK